VLEYFKKSVKKDVAESTNEETEMSVKQESTLKVTELETTLAAQVNMVSELQSKFTELAAKYEASQAALSTMVADKELSVKQKEEEKQAVRKEQLSTAIGTEKADAMLASLSVLDDVAFKSVVETMSLSIDKEAVTTFKETGVTTEPQSATEVVAHFKDYIKGNK
jgi:hypothetical protein